MKFKTIQQQTAVSGAAYGVGLLLGNLISNFLFNSVSPSRFLGGNQIAQLVGGIFLAFFITGIGGAVGGAIGGYTLPMVGRGKGRWGYTWRSSITFGIGYGLLVFPVILVLTLFTFYAVPDISPTVFTILFGIIGVIFGLIMGASLGFLSVGRRFPPITRISMLGFGVGGLALGYAIYNFIYSIAYGNLQLGSGWWLSIGFLIFGAMGGGSLGFAFHRLANTIEESVSPIRQATNRIWKRKIVIIGAIIFAVLLLLRPTIAAIGDILTPIDATLSEVLDLPTTGTHWLDTTAVTVTDTPPHPTLASNETNQLGLAWVQANTLWLQAGEWHGDQQQTDWQSPTAVTTSANLAEPEIVVDGNGRYHLVWSADGNIHYSQCTAGDCAQPAVVNTANACAGLSATDNSQPTLAIHNDELLLVWQNNGLLPYATWSMDSTPPTNASGCVPEVVNADSPRLATTGGTLIYANNEEIFTANYASGNWTINERLSNGRSPNIFIDNNGTTHAAWCENNLVIYWQGSKSTVANLPCLSRPELGLDDTGNIHVVWYADAVTNATGQTQTRNVLYEAAQNEQSWTAPAIVGQTPDGQTSLMTTNDGTLHLAWNTGEQLAYTAQTQYQCDDGRDLPPVSKAVYDVGRQGGYFPADDPIPYCQNQYDALLIAPNPDPAYSDAPAPPNGVFDLMGDMIRDAQYEVLFSTMWYNAPKNNDSPGSVIAAAVNDLYEKVKANPENYPRGMTVRILLDNPPELIVGENLTGQLWTLLDDLRHAGIDKMVDPEIGWRLEVADYEGNMPHSHVKTIIVDGKTAAANGFNMSYDHLPVEHYSGYGGGRLDMGIHMTGPVAQAAHRMFDDMWAGADQRICLDLNPPLSLPWQATCYDVTAVADHVPEVLKFYLPSGSSSDAFSLYRSMVHDAADQQTVAAINAAQDSIDLIHVQFTLDTICNLNILFDVCTVDIAPDYVPALIDAAERGVTVRILVKPSPTEGIENNVALVALQQRMEELGLDTVQIRFHEGPMHNKVIEIDNEFLIVGSQNLHYSAYGEGSGLNEYSFGTNDPQAIDDFDRFFTYYWDQAAPFSDFVQE